MPRRKQFRPEREPLRDHPELILQTDHVSGPVSFLNPTSARFKQTDAPLDQRPLTEETDSDERLTGKHTGPRASTKHIERVWTSRDNRKGRHAMEVDFKRAKEECIDVPESSTSLRSVAKGLLLMATYYPYWDVSWLVAFSFSVGSMVWVVNSFFVWLPLQDAPTQFPGEIATAGGITAFIGASIFELGSFLLYLEAINDNQTGCFGWAVDTVLKQVEGEIRETVSKVKPSPEQCVHHHATRRPFLPQGRQDSLKRSVLERIADEGLNTFGKSQSFRWVPSLEELRSHYLHELGFLASFVQLIGASIFWIAGFTGLPGIYNHLSQSVENGVYWVPQMAGGACFILSGFLFTLETQPKWYIPSPQILGWHVGFWNFIGGIGFTLCGALGPAANNPGVNYQSSLATFWGSWTFLLGSLIQWYESLDKHPTVGKKQS